MAAPVTPPMGILLTRPQTTVSLGQMVLSNGAIRNVTIAIEMDFGLGPNIDLSRNPTAAPALNQIRDKIEALMWSHQCSSALPDLRSETDQINDNALILRNGSIPPLLHTNAWSQTPAFRGYNAAADWNDLKMFIIQTVQSTISPRASPAIILPPPPAPPPLAPPMHHQKALTTIHSMVPHIKAETDLYETPPLPPPEAEASIPSSCRMLRTPRTSLRSPPLRQPVDYLKTAPLKEDRGSSLTARRPLATTTQPQPLYREFPPSRDSLSARTAQFEDPQPVATPPPAFLPLTQRQQQHTHAQRQPMLSPVWRQTPMTSSFTSSVAPLAQQTTPFFLQRRREEDDDSVNSGPRLYRTGGTPRGFPHQMKQEVPDEDKSTDKTNSLSTTPAEAPSENTSSGTDSVSTTPAEAPSENPSLKTQPVRRKPKASAQPQRRDYKEIDGLPVNSSV